MRADSADSEAEEGGAATAEAFLLLVVTALLVLLAARVCVKQAVSVSAMRCCWPLLRPHSFIHRCRSEEAQLANSGIAGEGKAAANARHIAGNERAQSAEDSGMVCECGAGRAASDAEDEPQDGSEEEEEEAAGGQTVRAAGGCTTLLLPVLCELHTTAVAAALCEATAAV
jgi:hypothetical protein